MTFHIITLFPDALEQYLKESVIGIARRKKLVNVKYYNLRDFSSDKKHKKIDDRPYGGGPGMVIEAQPVVKAVSRAIKGKAVSGAKVIIFSPNGKQFDEKYASGMAKRYKHIVLIAGRYEGIDERVKRILNAEEVSIGPYVLTGGEIPALVLVDAVSRHVKGVLGKEESLEENRYGVGVPVYTRPETLNYKGKKYSVPKVLLSGNHAEIDKWKKERGKAA